MGLKSMFSQSADFSLISDEPVFISKILQKVFIEVDEKGSEAVAATGWLQIHFIAILIVHLWNFRF